MWWKGENFSHVLKDVVNLLLVNHARKEVMTFKTETETMYHISYCREALAHQRCNSFGNFFVEPKDISTASFLFVRDTRDTGFCGENNTGLHNKPKPAVHPELLLANPLGRYDMFCFERHDSLLWD
jgi:hypothetical protein